MRARGCAAGRLQEDAGRSPARRRSSSTRRRLPRLLGRASRRTSRSACSTRRASARSRSSSGSRSRTASARTRSSSTTTSTSTGPRSPRRQIKREDVTPDNFGRIAAQTAKQVILQRIREAERAMMYDEYVDRVSEVVTGIVQQAGDRNNVLVDLGKVEALLPRSEQVDGERYEQGSRIKAVITEVRSGTKGPQVILSRRDPELIRTLFELEVPEIADGLVEIRGVAREPGYRSKIAVESHAQGVDPVGACVGPARLARPHGRVRAARREDRHHPVEQRAGAVRGQGAVARTRARGLHRRRRPRGDRRRAGRPARAGDRQGGHERPPRRAAHRLEGRHPVRHRVRDRPRPTRPTAAEARRPASSPAAAPRCSRTASAAPTRRCRALATAASLRTRSWRARRPRGSCRSRSPSSSPRLKSRPPRSHSRSWRSPLQRRRREPEPEPAGGRRGRRSGGQGGRDRCVSAPIRTCAGCGRKAPQAELLRFAAQDGALAPGAEGPRARRLHVPAARLLRAGGHAARVQPHAEARGAGRSRAGAALH